MTFQKVAGGPLVGGHQQLSTKGPKGHELQHLVSIYSFKNAASNNFKIKSCHLESSGHLNIEKSFILDTNEKWPPFFVSHWPITT